ncbi:hypothetical protein B1A99_17660 [Cohnella sp. CIP 111063]|uniref:carboxypeptidase regulatory-like domain-containing protein n=1 Tax=unclassified Cohnella TaxID=2636738 RepID=UPI000B8C693E|nr:MULTISPECIES: carboxypeptidase regulatory-like domain-containing protein [unclassified Cohnella]OXS57315.1 hypothetical protein B1A99_17660 [Cohnella sp. CIP 111063]PRX70756.1 carboxypeptidase family protein [Cohnella sp. SGD-V74]
MTKARLFVLLIAAAALWTGTCAGANAPAQAPQARIELEKTSFTVKTWRTDGSHIAAVKGKLICGGQPVAGAEVQAGLNKRRLRTGEDGSFDLRVDRSLLAYAPIRVVSANEAKIAGKPIGQREADGLASAFAAITVYHPIQVIGEKSDEADASRVNVQARIRSEAGDAISFFQVDKYRIAGRVEDADGNPVKGAIVWIDRDRGEGFAKSTPTDGDGKYEMFYWPEEEETNLTVIVGPRRYALPEGKAFVLPRHTSVDIRIRLPREGVIIDDKPPTLMCETAKGATYSGLLAGLDVPPDVPYTVTIPDRDGRFVLTVAKEVWERRPALFETRLTKFIGQEKVLKAGDALPVGFVAANDQDPRVIPSAS